MSGDYVAIGLKLQHELDAKAACLTRKMRPEWVIWLHNTRDLEDCVQNGLLGCTMPEVRNTASRMGYLAA